MDTRTAISTIRPPIEHLSLSDDWHARIVAGSPNASATAEQWRPVLEQLVADAERLPGYTVLKYSPDGEVIRATPRVGDHSLEIVCKRSGADGSAKKLARLVGATREARNFARSLAVRAAGIPTAEPLALLERRSAAWLITRFVPGLTDLDQIALAELARLDATRARRVRNAITGAVIATIVTLEERHLIHRDLKASNILLDRWDDPQGVCVWLIDLEGLAKRKIWHGKRRWKPLVRLAASLEGYATVGAADRARFVRRYLVATEGTDDRWREVFTRLAGEAKNYARRSRRRKSHKLDGYTAT